MATSDLTFRILGKDDASGAFLSVAAAAEVAKKSFGDMGGAALGLTKLVGGAGLIPAAAGASAVLAELGTSAAAGGLALGVFGASAVGILAGMAKAQVQIKATQLALSKLTPGTAAYTAKLKELHNQQFAFNKTFGPAAKGYNDMTNAFTKFKNATGKGGTLSVLNKGFELIAKVLPRLVPVSNAAAHAVGGLLDGLTKWTQGPGFTKVLHWLETSGPKAITAFGTSAGHIISGLAGIFANFVGPGDKAAATMQDLTARFDAWGHSKGVSDSVDKFLRYVSDNGGKITSTLQSLATIAPKLATAMGGLGSANLTAISLFLNLLAGMNQGVFDVVVKGLFGILVAAKGLALIQGVAAAMGVLSASLHAVKGAALGTRIQLGLLWAQEKIGAAVAKGMAAAQWLLNAAMDANPIVLVVAAIALLAVGMVIAYKHSATFRAIVHDALTAVGTAGQWMWKNALQPAFAGIVTGLKVVGGWARWLWNNAFQPALHFIVSGIGFLVGIWAHMLSALGHVPGFGWAKTAGAALQAAADQAQHLADNINKIPTHHDSTVVLNVIHNVVHTTGGHVPAMAAGGIVRRPTLALIGEAGPEAVVPLSRGGFGGGGGAGGDLGTVTLDLKLDGRTTQKVLLKLKRENGGLALGLA